MQGVKGFTSQANAVSKQNHLYKAAVKSNTLLERALPALG